MYNEIVNSLDSISQFASSTGLERGRQLLHDMNNPEKSLKIIHVAGTNGKGSVCAYIAGILQHNGYKAGIQYSRDQGGQRIFLVGKLSFKRIA